MGLKGRIRRCKHGHVYDRLYGDAILHSGGIYLCEVCPKSSDTLTKDDIVVDPVLGDIQKLRHQYRGLHDR